MEKFFDIKCRTSGLVPNCVVLVATVRALKSHGGVSADSKEVDMDALLEGTSTNLVAHIENASKFNVPVVVCINRFVNDTDEELELVQKICLENGAAGAVVSEHWSYGGAGAQELAEKIIAVVEEEQDSSEEKAEFKYLYELEGTSIKEKIETLATQIYGADGVEYSETAEAKIALYTEQGFDNLPICMAKTHLSLSHDPKLKGRPTGFTFPIEDIRASVGAGFLYPLAGAIRTMPGLPTRPCFFDVDLDLETGEVLGLF
eukprot:TRINITY_DN1012_c0_g1_i5.p1 TRINITY_DN1012_c0_g1~~TRINITY_DN1012_c0_g1_i5.p1  ORF type:complete len:260 (-),score=87.59 TRINITY_DN1012_c0_g1_i5:114-893(-)